MLLTEGIEVRRHGSLDRLVQRDFVRGGRLDPEIGADLTRLQALRQSADCLPRAEPASRRLVPKGRGRAGASRGQPVARRQPQFLALRFAHHYSAEHVFTEHTARDSIAMARRFVTAVTAILAAARWLER